MSAFKEYTMMFQLNAKLGGSYSKAFKQAVQELESMQKEIQELSKMQADISAFQKQQAAVEATRKRLEMLRQQYDNRKTRAERHAPGDFASPQAKQQADTQMIPPLTSLGK